MHFKAKENRTRKTPGKQNGNSNRPSGAKEMFRRQRRPNTGRTEQRPHTAKNTPADPTAGRIPGEAPSPDAVHPTNPHQEEASPRDRPPSRHRHSCGKKNPGHSHPKRIRRPPATDATDGILESLPPDDTQRQRNRFAFYTRFFVNIPVKMYLCGVNTSCKP